VTDHLEPVSPRYQVPAAPERSGPAAADANPEYLVLGLAASLRAWQPGQFAKFLAWFGDGHDGEPVPLRLNHEKWRVTSRGAEPANVGECLKFASVPADTTPGGLLMLGVLHPPFASGILDDMHNREQWRALSIGGAKHEWKDRREPGDLWLGEVSLVDAIGNQGDDDALVIADGRRAAVRWELLTGTPAFP
jgi:hypothetical protein